MRAFLWHSRRWPLQLLPLPVAAAHATAVFGSLATPCRHDQGRKILIEGANATMLDIDFGTYPCEHTRACTCTCVCSCVCPLLWGMRKAAP